MALIDSVVETPISRNHLFDRVRHLAIRAGTPAILQIANQAVAMVTALAVVRSLAPEQYALYSLAGAALAITNILADSGNASSLSTVLGKAWDDPRKLQTVINTSLRAIRRNLIFSVPIAVLVFLATTHSIASWESMLITAVLFVATAWLTSTQNVLQQVPLFSGRHVSRLLAILSGQWIRLTAIIILIWTGYHSSESFMLAGFLGIGISLCLLWKGFRNPYPELSDQIDIDFQHKINYTTQILIPNTLFYAFQGQISLIIISIFGQSQGVAQVAALGRVALVFGLLSSLFAIWGPVKFAKIAEPERLRYEFAIIIGSYCFPVIVTGLLLASFPQLFLMILGRNYVSLSNEVPLIIWANVLGVISGAIWSLLAARSLISYAWAFIPISLVTQIFCITTLEVSSVHGVLLMALIVAGAEFIFNLTQYYLLLIRKRSVDPKI